MNDDDKFFFDLKGFAHLKGVLSQEEVDRCNAAIDAHADRLFPDRAHPRRKLQGSRRREQAKVDGGDVRMGTPRTCEPFRDLLVHAKIQPYLNGLLGGGYRLDHGPLAHCHGQRRRRPLPPRRRR